jgi:hypothetical protein
MTIPNHSDTSQKHFETFSNDMFKDVLCFLVGAERHLIVNFEVVTLSKLIQFRDIISTKEH